MQYAAGVRDIGDAIYRYFWRTDEDDNRIGVVDFWKVIHLVGSLPLFKDDHVVPYVKDGVMTLRKVTSKEQCQSPLWRIINDASRVAAFYAPYDQGQEASKATFEKFIYGIQSYARTLEALGVKFENKDVINCLESCSKVRDNPNEIIDDIYDKQTQVPKNDFIAEFRLWSPAMLTLGTLLQEACFAVYLPKGEWDTAKIELDEYLKKLRKNYNSLIHLSRNQKYEEPSIKVIEITRDTKPALQKDVETEFADEIQILEDVHEMSRSNELIDESSFELVVDQNNLRSYLEFLKIPDKSIVFATPLNREIVPVPVATPGKPTPAQPTPTVPKITPKRTAVPVANAYE